MEGLHIIANFYFCDNEKILIDKNLLKKELKELIIKNGLNIVGDSFYKFENAGITGIYLISESHVSVHTWPELDNSINLDIFTCNVSNNNEEKTRNLFKDMKILFKPKKTKYKSIKR